MDYNGILKQYWGYDSFRGIQREIIESIGSGKDTLGLMPTGGGKSITFQVPALAKEGLCLVITPLIALMKDQVRHLREKGIKALAIYSGMSSRELDTAIENCIYGSYKFLYISPERLGTEKFLMRVRQLGVSMIAVDESHCISQWGYDFRPAYLRIASIRELLPEVPVLALTATATPEVVDDIQEKLCFKEKNVFRMSFERTNLAYIVRHTENKANEAIHILKKMTGSAIVYTRSRQDTKDLAERLNKEGISATYYHAGLDTYVRDERQKSWQQDEVRVMVATNAFGMGIDKPDVRLVIHTGVPDSVEAYFQEAGRAGRDGEKAYAVLLFSPTDKTSLSRRIPDTFPDKGFVRNIYEKLQYYYQMAMGDGEGCVKMFDMNEFCRRFKFFPVQTDSALRLLSQAGYIEYVDDPGGGSRLMFTVSREELYHQHISHNADILIQLTLRTYTGLFADYSDISEHRLAMMSGLLEEDVYQTFLVLSRQGVISYIPRRTTPYIIYTLDRVEKDKVVLPPSVYEDRKQKLTNRIKAMIEYASNDNTCRSRMLLHYFGEDNSHNCGQCDNCISNKRDGNINATCEKIIDLLTEQENVIASDVPSLIRSDKGIVANALNRLFNAEKISLKDGVLRLQKGKN